MGGHTKKALLIHTWMCFNVNSLARYWQWTVPLIGTMGRNQSSPFIMNFRWKNSYLIYNISTNLVALRARPTPCTNTCIFRGNTHISNITNWCAIFKTCIILSPGKNHILTLTHDFIFIFTFRNSWGRELEQLCAINSSSVFFS